MTALIVIGAGPSGLGVATTLARETGDTVCLVDRIPVPGGEAGWDDPQVRAYVADAEAAGVQLLLGHMAVRWAAGVLLLLGPGVARTEKARHLFFAGGCRPATAADLRLAGERPAGVLPATVAEHLLTSGVGLWHRPLLIGDGPWASSIGEHIRRTGARVLSLNGQGDWADETICHDGAVEVLGRDRVRGVRLLDGPGSVPRDVDCDAIILCAGAIPNRNVDGALTESDEGVTFVQPTAPRSVRGRFEHGQSAAREWIRSMEGNQ